MMTRPHLIAACRWKLLALASAAGIAAAVASPSTAMANDPTPIFSDFMGINGHSHASFNPAVYGQAAKLVRDYHPLSWDVGTNTGTTVNFTNTPGNGVNWDGQYGPWVSGGMTIDASVQIESINQNNWQNMAADAYKYGHDFAQHFGPTSGNGLVSSVEIGNEPGSYSDANYLTVFSNMAAGLKSGDPTIKIVTANMTTGPSGNYSKSLDSLKASTTATGAPMRAIDQADVITVHTYAFKNGYPTWQRSYPEDASIDYLSSVQNVIDWRNTNAPGKQIWVTEFGYDSSTKPNNTTGDFKDWDGNLTDTKQAQYLARSYLAFSAMDVQRAYMFYYNDSDEPQIHGSSGLTRNFVPKPSYYAISQMQSVLGNYHFDGIIKQIAGDVYIYAYKSESDPTQAIWAIWSPTGTDREVLMNIDNLPGTPDSAQLMALAAGSPTLVAFNDLGNHTISMMVGESPIYLHLTSVPEPLTAWPVIGLAVAAICPRRRSATSWRCFTT